MTFWGREKFLERPAGGEADEAHAHAYDIGVAPHDARLESAGDRPRHEPGEHVGPVHEDVSLHLSAVPHEHGAHLPHESPRSMWIPLAVLAVLATIGGFIGISPAFTGGKHVGGRLNIVNFLDPIIWNPTTRYFGTEEMLDSYGKPLAGVESRPILTTAPTPVAVTDVYGHEEGFNLAHGLESKLRNELATEWVFIIISVLVAGLGIGLGFLFYVKDTRLPDLWAARLRPLYEASYHKYWVDEFFGLTVTRRVMDLARAVFAFDSKVVDGGVNGTAWFTRLSSRITGLSDQYFVDGIVNGIAAFIIRLMSPLLRAAQTGFTQNYALVMVLGLIAAVAMMFGADVLGWLKR